MKLNLSVKCLFAVPAELKCKKLEFFSINDLFVLGGKNISLSGVKKSLMLSRASIR